MSPMPTNNPIILCLQNIFFKIFIQPPQEMSDFCAFNKTEIIISKNHFPQYNLKSRRKK